jgi:DNA mismatch repair ATPase MutS
MESLLKRAQKDVNPKTVWKISGSDYLFEVPSSSTKNDKIPKEWREEKISAKTKRRFNCDELRKKSAALIDAQTQFDLLSRVAVTAIVAKFAEGLDFVLFCFDF